MTAKRKATINRTCVPRREWHTTTDNLDALWDVINRRRQGTEKVSVRVEDLIPVLRDHATMSDELMEG